MTRIRKIAAAAVAASVATGTALLPALAAITEDTGLIGTASEAGYGDTQDLSQLIGRTIQSMMGFVGVILFSLIVYAGFLWMTAQGNDEKIKKAKGIVRSAAIGLLLIFAAYSLTDYVVSGLVEPLLTE